MDNPTVYLAGPVAAYDDGGAEWRDVVKSEYEDYTITFLDPLDKYNVPAEDLSIVPGKSDPGDDTTVGITDIVESDKQMLRDSDAVLVGYSDVKSIGTPMEVMWAKLHGLPVIMWIRDETFAEALSPWYRHHADEIAYSLDDAHDAILYELLSKVGSD